VPAPDQIVGHLRETGYHPRSNVHGKILCEFSGHLVYGIQRKIIVAGSEWNIDLVLGPPPAGLALIATIPTPWRPA
jgi:hypothetical protein